MPTFKQLWNAVLHHDSIDPQTDRIIDALGNLPVNLAVLVLGTIGILAWLSLDDWRKHLRARRWRTWEEALKDQEASRK